jgi:hypothetical protein
VKALGREWLDEFARLSKGYWTWTTLGRGRDDETLAAIALMNRRDWESARALAPEEADLLQGLREAWKTPLEQRAALVADTAAYAVRLLDSLQREIAARSALVEALASEVQSAHTQATHSRQVASLNEVQAAAVNAFLDRLLKARLDDVEHQARRREWVLATGVALIIGVAAILVSHYLIGF